ncbi:MAG: RNA polymerase sigma factor [Bacteroidales bacterium]|jgi:RNA polymerase sigma-70 factor (ECF subfamily)|nr:RNA polymerase sigma factor [Bacteroidales bacterium]
MVVPFIKGNREMEDLVVAKKIAQGDKQVFETFFNEYNLKLLNLCYGMLHNRAEAEDLVQEVFIEIFNNAKYFKGNAKLSTWVYRIAINKTISHIRKKKIRNIFIPLENIQVSDTDSDWNEQELKLKYLKAAIDSLPAKQRTAMVLFTYDQMPQKDIAEVMNCSLAAVEVMIHRAKKILKQKLETKYKEIEQ